jgi:hypothetical protein
MRSLNYISEFPARDSDQHKDLGEKFRRLETAEDRERFFSENGVRWSEFARLEYFDIVKWTVIDPMHNLLLGECNHRPHSSCL